MWAKVKSDNLPDGSEATNAVVTAHSIDMPISIRHPRKTRTLIGTPASIAPLSLATEIEITSSLTTEPNSLHCLNLAERPNIKRGSGLPTAELGGCKLIMVGSSHTAKISALSRHSGSREYIPLPGHLLSADMVTNLEEKIRLYNQGEKDIFYIDLHG